MGYKGCPVCYALHARKRMRERGISEQDVRDALDSPDTEVPSKTNPGCKVLSKRFSTNYAVGAVVVPPSLLEEAVLVVTAYRK